MTWRAGDLHPDQAVITVGEAAQMAAIREQFLNRVLRLVVAGVSAGLLTRDDCTFATDALDGGCETGEVLDYITTILNRSLDAP